MDWNESKWEYLINVTINFQYQISSKCFEDFSRHAAVFAASASDLTVSEIGTERNFVSNDVNVKWQWTHQLCSFFCVPQPPIQGYRGLLLRGKEAGSWSWPADHSPTYSAKVKNMWSYKSTPKFIFMAWCLVKHRDNFTFTLDHILMYEM